MIMAVLTTKQSTLMNINGQWNTKNPSGVQKKKKTRRRTEREIGRGTETKMTRRWKKYFSKHSFISAS